MSATDPNIERAMVEADEAHTAAVVRRFTGLEPQPDPSGLLGAVPAPGEATEEEQYQQYMRRFFPQAAG